MTMAFLFFGLVTVFFIMAVETNAMVVLYNGDSNHTEISAFRNKRQEGANLAAALIKAAAKAIGTEGFKQLFPTSRMSCNVAIATDEPDGKLHMNFVSSGDIDNCNDEILGGRDSTSEGVTGGQLKYITVEIEGHACLEYFAVSCGEEVTGRERRNFVLSHESFPFYHCMMHKKWKEDPCVWIHQTNKDNIRKFFINKDIFDCGERDYSCHRNHIGTQIGGCVDMTQCKFCNNRCK